MKVLQIVGIVLVIAAVAFGYFAGFSESWMIAVVAGAAGLMMVIMPEVEKSAKGKKWRPILIAFGLTVGTMLAIGGGMAEATITMIIGLVIAVLTAVGSFVIKKE